MSDLLVELGLRLGKVVGAAVIGLVVYGLMVGPLGVPGSAQLGLEAWIAGAIVILLLERSPF